MASDALRDFVSALDEVDDLETADPTPPGGAPMQPSTSRVIGRASVVLLSSHFERYIYAVNEEATQVLNGAGLPAGEDLPEKLRLLHSKHPIDEMVKTDWVHRAEKLTDFTRSDAWLWGGQPPGPLDHEMLLTWMKAPTPGNLIRYYRLWNIDDIFRAVTRAPHTRTDLHLKLEELVAKRNNIAHGDLSTEATPGDVRGYRDAVRKFCERSDGRLSSALAQIVSDQRPW